MDQLSKDQLVELLLRMVMGPEEEVKPVNVKLVPTKKPKSTLETIYRSFRIPTCEYLDY